MSGRRADATRSRGRSLVLAAALVVASCATPGPGIIRYDTDACDHCRMTIADASFAAQLVTQTGKIYRFDDPGCLASFVATGRVAAADVHSAWVNDHVQPETSIRVENAVFLVSDKLRGPMNSGVAAFGSTAAAAAIQTQLGGALERWDAIVKRGRP